MPFFPGLFVLTVTYFASLLVPIFLITFSRCNFTRAVAIHFWLDISHASIARRFVEFYANVAFTAHNSASVDFDLTDILGELTVAVVNAEIKPPARVIVWINELSNFIGEYRRVCGLSKSHVGEQTFLLFAPLEKVVSSKAANAQPALAFLGLERFDFAMFVQLLRYENAV